MKVLLTLKTKLFSMLAICLIMLAAVLTAKGVHIPDSSDMRVLLYSEDSFSNAVANRLINGEHEFKFVRAASKESLTKDVVSGKADCGFILANGINTALSKGQFIRSNCVTSPFSTKASVAKESVTNAILSQYSSEILENGAKELFGTVPEDIAKVNGKYLSGDSLFSIELHDSKGNDIDTAPKPLILHIICSVLILMYGFLIRCELASSPLVPALVPNKRQGYFFGTVLGALIPPALTAFVLVLHLESFGLAHEIFALIILLLYCPLWSEALCLITKGKTSMLLPVLCVLAILCAAAPAVLPNVTAVKAACAIFPCGAYTAFFL